MGGRLGGNNRPYLKEEPRQRVLFDELGRQRGRVLLRLLYERK